MSFQYLAPIRPFDYEAPSNFRELLEALNNHGGKAKLLAGGTDLTIALKQRTVEPGTIIDMSGLRSELSGISVQDGKLRIGSMATYTSLERSPLVNKFARALSIAASQVGTYQIRNLGTIGGNLANASPAADTAPPLIALSAQVHVFSKRGERVIPVEALFSGVKKTVLSPDEVISSIEIPADERRSSHWMRFARRNENVISVVSVAVSSSEDKDRFVQSRIALGAVAPTPILASRSSSAMEGSPVSEETAERVASLAREESKPITVVRGGSDFRKHLVYVLTKRSVSKVAEGLR